MNPNQSLTAKADSILHAAFGHRWADVGERNDLWVFVLDTIRAAVTEEREACAQLVMTAFFPEENIECETEMRIGIAAAIRARGNA